MGEHAHIESGRIVIDTAAWLEQRTAGPLPHLTYDLITWAATQPSGADWPERVLAWLTLHECAGPDRSGPLVIHHELTRLDAVVWLAYARHRGWGRIVVVQQDHHYPAVYADGTRELEERLDADSIDIGCPNGHQWTWRTGSPLIDGEGSFTSLAAVFGTDPAAPFTACPGCTTFAQGHRRRPCRCDRSSWIVCPICGARCDAELTNH